MLIVGVVRSCIHEIDARSQRSLLVSSRMSDYRCIGFSQNILYSWEFVTSLDFEWDFISGKKKFRWPAVSYDQVSSVDTVYSLRSIIDILLCGTILFAGRLDRNVRELLSFILDYQANWAAQSRCVRCDCVRRSVPEDQDASNN